MRGRSLGIGTVGRAVGFVGVAAAIVATSYSFPARRYRRQRTRRHGRDVRADRSAGARAGALPERSAWPRRTTRPAKPPGPRTGAGSSATARADRAASAPAMDRPTTPSRRTGRRRWAAPASSIVSSASSPSTSIPASVSCRAMCAGSPACSSPSTSRWPASSGRWRRTRTCIARLIKKTLYIGVFAFIIGNFNNLAQIIFNSFAGLGLEAGGGTLSQAQLLQPGRLAQVGIDAGKPILQLDLGADGLRQLLRQLHPDRHPADRLADRRRSASSSWRSSSSSA